MLGTMTRGERHTNTLQHLQVFRYARPTNATLRSRKSIPGPSGSPLRHTSSQRCRVVRCSTSSPSHAIFSASESSISCASIIPQGLSDPVRLVFGRRGVCPHQTHLPSPAGSEARTWKSSTCETCSFGPLRASCHARLAKGM